MPWLAVRRRDRPEAAASGRTRQDTAGRANDQLKKKLVDKEGRSDLLGHGGDTETSERYCEPHEIATLLKFVMELPVVTADLQPGKINLIPWEPRSRSRRFLSRLVQNIWLSAAPALAPEGGNHHGKPYRSSAGE